MSATVIIRAKEVAQYQVQMTESQYERFLENPEAVWEFATEDELVPLDVLETQVLSHEIRNYRSEVAA